MSQANMTLRQKVGQTMMFGFHGMEPTEEITRLIRDHHVGGIIVFARNIGHPSDVLKLTVALQKIAYEAGHSHPLLISIDQENGIVRRLGAGTTLLPGSMAIGATGKPENAFEVSRATGRELKALGINFNLAPVVDLNGAGSRPSRLNSGSGSWSGHFRQSSNPGIRRPRWGGVVEGVAVSRHPLAFEWGTG